MVGVGGLMVVTVVDKMVVIVVAMLEAHKVLVD